MPDPKNYPEELWGIEDPRITYVPELGKYVVVYTSFSASGPGVSLALTEDFRTFERYGDILPPEDKDAALLPRRIGNHWALLHRPVSGTLGANIWLSYSPDLRHWGSHRVILEARRGAWWDANKIGLSPPPIETPQGWLFLYHGVRKTAGGCSTGSASPSLISTHQNTACAAATPGSSAPRPPMNATVMSIMSYSPVATPSRRTATRSIFTTAVRIVASPWPPEVCAGYWTGWKETANPTTRARNKASGSS